MFKKIPSCKYFEVALQIIVVVIVFDTMCCTPKSCMRNRNNFKEHFDKILFRKFCATRCSNSSVRRTMLSLHFFETCRILDQILNQTQIQVNFVSTGNYFRPFFSTKNKTSKIINLCVFETINQIGIINGAKYEAKKKSHFTPVILSHRNQLINYGSDF